MKALTICQPYPALICLPTTDPRHKRVENRTWYCHHRGRMAIHAGVSKEMLKEAWLRDEYGDEIYVDENGKYPPLVYGAVVAICEVTGCFYKDAPIPHPEFQWVVTHSHFFGPIGIVLENVRVLKTPIPARGFQKLWNWEPPANLEFTA